jgi:hypothetical protein
MLAIRLMNLPQSFTTGTISFSRSYDNDTARKWQPFLYCGVVIWFSAERGGVMGNLDFPNIAAFLLVVSLGLIFLGRANASWKKRREEREAQAAQTAAERREHAQDARKEWLAMQMMINRELGRTISVRRLLELELFGRIADERYLTYVGKLNCGTLAGSVQRSLEKRIPHSSRTP